MRIEDRNASNGIAAGRPADVEALQAASATKARGISGSSPNDDSVQLSGASVSIRAFNALRSARVEQLAKDIQAGSYAVHPQLIGRALLNETLAATGEAEAR